MGGEEYAGGAPKGGRSTAFWVVVVLAGCGCLAVPVVAIVAAIAIPNLIKARQQGNEASAIGALRTIATAQEIYKEGDKDQNGVLDYAPDLAALAQAQLIDSVLGSGTKQGFHFALERGADATRQWSATATPVVPGQTGNRSFYMDQAGVITWEEGGKVANVKSPRLGR